MKKIILKVIKDKKSQMEAFGLAVIIVLVFIGIVVFLSLQKPSTENPRQSYVNDQMATNFVNSIVNVHVKECIENKYTVLDLIRFCQRGDLNTLCHGERACFLANKTITDIANKSLMRQGLSFHLYTKGLNDEINITYNNCNNNKDRGQRGLAVITLHPQPGDVLLNLDICK
jgi:hypothetical protein